MNAIGGLLTVLTFSSTYAGTCDLISGAFKTTNLECRSSRDGVTFSPEGHQKISISYSEGNKILDVNMVSNNYTLQYFADGKERAGRPQYEGVTYTARCENNQVRIRSVLKGLKHPLITEFTANAYGQLAYKQSFEGGKFVRICEMNRY